MRLCTTALTALSTLGMAGAAAVEKRQSRDFGTPQNMGTGWIMCNWIRPMTARVRNMIYLDGGFLEWAEVEDGVLVSSSKDSSPRNELYSIDLRQPWQMSRVLNVSSIVQSTPKGGFDTNPSFENGHMLANNYSFYQLGGSILSSDTTGAYPDLDWGQAYDIHARPDTVLRNPNGFRVVQTGPDVNRGFVQGAYTSAPSEDKGWIFGGSMNDKGVDVRTREYITNHTAEKISNFLITADLSSHTEEKWENSTLPDDIKGRSLAEVAWLPVSNNGALVVIGGTSMTYQQSEWYEEYSEKEGTKWKKEGQEYMQQISIYDVGAKEWYKQNTTGEIPPPTADFCSVVTTSENGKSHHIYIYGGYNGMTISGREMLPPSETGWTEFDGTYDTAYVLSIPAFHWTKVYDGDETGRRGHRCHRVADNTMLVIGGYSYPETHCLPGNLIRPFNLNDPKFETQYHPENNAPFKIPSAVTADIGGDENGGDKIADWDNEDLANVFSNEYTKEVNHDWPFSVLAPEGGSESGGDGDNDDSGSNGSALPTWVGPVIGTTVGTVVLGGAVAAFLYLRHRRRRKIRRLQSDSAASTVVKRRQTWSWLMNTRDGPEKGGFEDYAGTEHGPDYDGSTVYGSPNVERPNPLNTFEVPNTQISEAPETQIYEMPANEVLQEMPTGTAPATRASQTVTFNDEVEQLGPRPPPSEMSDPISPLTPRPSLKKTTFG